MNSKDSQRELETSIGYHFENDGLLKLALTHPSLSGEMKKTRIESNQRLEFLGDAVLELIVSEYLYEEHPDVEEGELTRMRSSLVFEAALCLCAKKIGLGKHVLLGKGEDLSGGREKPSILSDTFEAVIGAIYLDGGFSCAKKFISDHVLSCVEEMVLLRDSKTALQELVQKEKNGTIRYETVSVGEGMNVTFRSDVYINEVPVASGAGHSKKAAEQDAAFKAVKKYSAR